MEELGTGATKELNTGATEEASVGASEELIRSYPMSDYYKKIKTKSQDKEEDFNGGRI